MGEVDLAARERRVPRLGIGDGDDLNRVDGRSASPVIGVLLKHGSSVGREGNELEGPAADVAREIVTGAARREHEGDGGNDLVPEGGLRREKLERERALVHNRAALPIDVRVERRVHG